MIKSFSKYPIAPFHCSSVTSHFSVTPRIKFYAGQQTKY